MQFSFLALGPSPSLGRHWRLFDEPADDAVGGFSQAGAVEAFEDDAVGEDQGREALDVVGHDERPPLDQRERLSRPIQAEGAARRDAHPQLVGIARAVDDIQQVFADRLLEGDGTYGVLECHDLLTFDDRLQVLHGFAVAMTRQHAPLVRAADRAKAVIAYGETGPALHRRIPASDLRRGFDAAVRRALEVARPGDVVLLSPGFASYDEFPGFDARGDRFRELIGAPL